MSDSSDPASKRTAMLSMLRGRNNAQPTASPAQVPTVMNKKEREERAFMDSWGAFNELREHNEALDAKYNKLDADHQQMRSDFASEIMRREREWQADKANLMANNDLLGKKLTEAGKQIEVQGRWGHRLEEKIENLGQLFRHHLQKIYDDASHLKIGIVKEQSNAMTALTDSVDHLISGFFQGVTTTVNEMRARLEDIERQKGHREYVPSGASKAAAEPPPELAPNDQAFLRRFAARLDEPENKEPDTA